ncbi:MAG: hypothetical protein JWM99_1799 [Verrucomicrobiales bacterium]|nr:hypothetical protein [Verrucomicrobiales bacterium]
MLGRNGLKNEFEAVVVLIVMEVALPAIRRQVLSRE